MSTEAIAEARRQIEICNACRYCEGFCAVFPAMTRQKAFSDGDMTHLANLCHNCRGCYYSCQYTPPHEFLLNLPAALADARQESWERYAVPATFAKRFHESGVAITLILILGFAVLFGLIRMLPTGDGEGFYAVMGHNAMVALFAPAFILPLLSVGYGLSRYWRDADGGRLRLADIVGAAKGAASMRNLSGGQGQGCNFEQEDRYSDHRRWFHQAVLFGFLLCFASTSSGTILHYLFDWPAPYPLLSPPKLLGVPGGILLMVGTVGLAVLKTIADPALGARRVWGGEMAFILLLFAVAATGMALWLTTGTEAMPTLLAIHLGAVLAFFLLLPFTKMVHGFYRFTALIIEEGKRASAKASKPVRAVGAELNGSARPAPTDRA